MRRLAAAATAVLLAACSQAAQPERQIARDNAWGCRERQDTVDLLFLGSSAAFDTKLSHDVGQGLCAYFKAGEKVAVLDHDPMGLVRLKRSDEPAVLFWTLSQNLK